MRHEWLATRVVVELLSTFYVCERPSLHHSYSIYLHAWHFGRAIHQQTIDKARSPTPNAGIGCPNDEINCILIAAGR